MTVSDHLAEQGRTDLPSRILTRKRYGNAVAGVIVALLVALLLTSAFTNDNFSWPAFGHYLFSPAILAGLGRTVELAVIAMALSIVVGVVLAILRQSSSKVLNAVSGAYIWVFRATPLLVLLLLLYNFAALYPRLSLGVPLGPDLFSVETNSVITVAGAAIIGLTLHEAAYCAEIFRAGLISVEHGQREAAEALGMSSRLSLRRIVLPQAMRAIVPPLTNQFVNVVKTTSIVSVISMPELLYSAQIIYARTYETIPLLLVVTFWYLVLTAVLTVGQHYVERHFNRGRQGVPALKERR
ncbi:amino acid ABC transporter permease [Amycolatopsis jiangsuensis]|uniref:Polar amino acid transport system permease protein n=1 Tax=Amycolatopsis jiangsuensis TaxID=1181879 RepID=A0A840J079_9PSEU|nr:amino acid ABC transporter permease [Amycolatopsis jiangsuensis]MBB4688346.1 polar amino acid transport system permease protein [Amycolatopsis jiangsuensis]